MIPPPAVAVSTYSISTPPHTRFVVVSVNAPVLPLRVTRVEPCRPAALQNPFASHHENEKKLKELIENMNKDY